MDLRRTRGSFNTIFHPGRVKSYRNLGVHFDNRLDRKCNTEALQDATQQTPGQDEVVSRVQKDRPTTQISEQTEFCVSSKSRTSRYAVTDRIMCFLLLKYNYGAFMAALLQLGRWSSF